MLESHALSGEAQDPAPLAVARCGTAAVVFLARVGWRAPGTPIPARRQFPVALLSLSHGWMSSPSQSTHRLFPSLSPFMKVVPVRATLLGEEVLV